MIMNLNILAATIRSFKMLIDYTLDLTPPLLPLPPIPPSKDREDEETALKFPLVLAHVVIANTLSYIVKQHMYVIYRECKGSNPCNTNVTGGSRVIVAE